MSLRPTDFHVRWYHAYSTVAFFVANLWNFQLNRQWTFRSSGAAGWWREYVPFLTVGLLTQGVGLLLLTLLMHRGSPLALPHDLFDDSSIWLTRLYWAQLIVIGDHAAVVRTQQDLDVRGRTRVALSRPRRPDRAAPRLTAPAGSTDPRAGRCDRPRSRLDPPPRAGDAPATRAHARRRRPEHQRRAFRSGAAPRPHRRCCRAG